MKSISKYLLTMLVIVLTTTITMSQNSVYINEPSIVSRMMFHVKEQNQMKPSTKGWRIQVLATTDRQELETVKAEFQEKYPGVLVDWEHTKPYYKLQAGAFESKLDATYLLYQLKKEYPSAYPIKDNSIPYRQLLKSYYKGNE